MLPGHGSQRITCGDSPLVVSVSEILEQRLQPRDGRGDLHLYARRILEVRRGNRTPPTASNVLETPLTERG